MKGGHRFGQFLIKKTFQNRNDIFFYAFAPKKSRGSDKPGSLLLLAFSEIQPSLFTPVSSSLPVMMLLDNPSVKKTPTRKRHS